MNVESPPSPSAKTRSALGRVTAVNGSQATIVIEAGVPTAGEAAQVTVGRFMGIIRGTSTIIGLVIEVTEQQTNPDPLAYRSIARLDLIGEIGPDRQFQRGVADYPTIGNPVVLVDRNELGLIYGGADNNRAHVGDLQQDTSIGVNIYIDDLISKHFAILGTTGVGKSSSVAIILNEVLQARSNLRIFLVDPHNEYAPCFGDKAQVLTPRNLRLPFWLFNFEEVTDAFFGGRPGVEEEVEILSEVIPLAKAAYLQYRSNQNERSALAKKRDPRDVGFTADTPVPYRIEDLINLLDERMGKLENRTQRVTIHRLMTRIQTFRNHPRYSFMFEGANIGGDTMAEIIGSLFRLPIDDKPMTIMQLAGFPAEVVDSVVSVLCRMAFDFGLWSDGVSPLLFVCEEAHRYAPADKQIGFGPTKRALSRIAKEGRKYGVFLGLDHPTSGRDRSDHHLAVLDAVRDAAFERPRPVADPLRRFRRGGKSPRVHSVTWHARSVRFRRGRRAADPAALQGAAAGQTAEQRSRRQHQGCQRRPDGSRHDQHGDRALA